MAHTMKLLLSIHPETTERTGLGRTTIYRLIDEGYLEAVTVGRRRLVVAESVDAYVARLRAEEVSG